MTYPWEVPPPVYSYVGDAHNLFMAKGDALSEKAAEYASSLANFRYRLTPTIIPDAFNFYGQLSRFERPIAPTLDDAAFAVTPMEPVPLPPSFVGQSVDIGTIPEFNAVAPTLTPIAQPVRPSIALPTAPARPTLPTMPEAPDFNALAPEPVTFLSLNLPSLPTITLPTLTATRPEFNAPVLSQAGWEFTPEQYTSALLAKIQGRVSTWLDGQEALPAAIERALFDRGRARIDVEADEAVEQAWDDFASRGFSAPPGMLAGRIDTIRFNADKQRAEFNNAATIKSFDEALANLRLAVSSGIQLEGVTINLHIEEQRLLLASAQNLRDTGIAVLNASISEFNALMQGYQVDAQVLETRLKAELSKLDVMRLQIEAEKLKGEINEQSVRAYTAQWEAVRSAANIYESQVRAMGAQAEVLKIPIEIFSEETKAFEALWNAHGKEWDGYRAAVEADGNKAVVYRALTEAHSARIQGVVAYGGLKLDQERLRMQAHGQDIEAYKASMLRLSQLLDVDKTRLSAVGQKVAAQATIYRAKADVETAASASTDRTFQLGLERAKSEADAALETARIQSQEGVAHLNLLLEAQKTIATVFTQLASSTMSAMNYSASLSGGISSSYSLTESREL